jgi:hypothetical protein
MNRTVMIGCALGCVLGCAPSQSLDASLADAGARDGRADAGPLDDAGPLAVDPLADAGSLDDAGPLEDAARATTTASFALNRPGRGPVVRYVEDARRPNSLEALVSDMRRYVEAGYPEVAVRYPNGARFTVRGSEPGTGTLCTWRSWDSDTERLPINCVTWETAMAVCGFLGGRLPTEAEWERLSGGSPREDDLTGLFLSHPTSAEDSVVGPNYAAAGPQDRAIIPTWVGNVSEWTADVYAPYEDPRWLDDYETLITSDRASDPHTVRGSNYTTPLTEDTLSYAAHFVTARRAGETGPTVGFRCLFGGAR